MALFQKSIRFLIPRAEWSNYFNTYKTEINQLQTQIAQMVYKSYGLTDEEIGLVERELIEKIK